MTAASATPAHDLTDRPSLPGVLLAGLIGGVLAALATSAVAAIAKGLGVPLEAAPPDAAGPEAIPLAGFATMTLMVTAVGIVIALAIARWARRPQRTWIVTTVVLTVLSFAPSVTAGHASPGTKAVLVLSHIVAALIVIPVVARSLATPADA